MSNNKQETLDEAAKKYAEIYRCPATNDNEYCRHDIISAINFGAKWQQEQAKEIRKQEQKIAYESGFENSEYDQYEDCYELKPNFEDWYNQTFE